MEKGFKGDIVDSPVIEINPEELYIVIEESDLVDIIKLANAINLDLGLDLGLVSFNDTPVKEILAGGISVLSTDYNEMGRTVAEVVLNNKKGKIKNPFSFVVRASV